MSTAVKPTPGSVQRDSRIKVPDPTPTGAHFGVVSAGHHNSRTAELAYRIWQKRGCPEGQSDEIWFEAERTLKGD